MRVSLLTTIVNNTSFFIASIMNATSLNRGPVVRSGAAAFTASTATTGSGFFRLYSQVPDLVNGDAATFAFIFVSAGLAKEYHWVPDAVFGNMSAVTSDATMRARVMAEAGIHTHLLQANAVPQAKADVIALTLALGRSVARRAWGICDADVVATQKMNPRVTRASGTDALLVFAANGTLDAAHTPAGDLAGYDAVATIARFEAIWGTSAAPLRDAYFTFVARCAIGMPVCNGAVMVATRVHHYVDPHKGVCDAVVGQHRPAGMEIPGGLSDDEMLDVVCHKTHHVIDSSKLVYLARSGLVREKLAAIGEGAAAVRIPAKFDAERAAGAYHAVVSKAKGAAANANVAISTDAVDALVADTTNAIVSDTTQAGMVAAERLVSAFKTAHAYSIAWCAGYLAAMFDANNATRRARSVLAAYSVKSIMEEEPGAVQDGRAQFDLHRRWARERARAGMLPGVGLFGAAPPDDRGEEVTVQAQAPRSGP